MSDDDPTIHVEGSPLEEWLADGVLDEVDEESIAAHLHSRLLVPREYPKSAFANEVKILAADNLHLRKEIGRLREIGAYTEDQLRMAKETLADETNQLDAANAEVERLREVLASYRVRDIKDTESMMRDLCADETGGAPATSALRRKWMEARLAWLESSRCVTDDYDEQGAAMRAEREYLRAVLKETP